MKSVDSSPYSFVSSGSGSGELLVATTWSRTIAIHAGIPFLRYPENWAQRRYTSPCPDDYYEHVGGFSFALPLISSGVILDAHNVFSHSAVALDCVKDTPN